MRVRDVSSRAARVTAAAIAIVVAVAAAAVWLLTLRGERGIDVAAAAPDPWATIEVESAAHDAAVEVEIRKGGPAAGRPEPWRIPLVGGRTHVDLSDGRPARAYVATNGGVVWPRSAELTAGGTVSFRVEPLRTLVLVGDCGPDEPTGRPPRVRFIPDRAVIPDGAAARVDALQAWIDTECVAVVPREGAVEARVPPGTAWWVLAQVPGGPCIAHVAAHGGQRQTVRLEPSARRTLHVAPTLNGAPLPGGTLVAPGRLDLFAATAARSAVLDVEFSGAVVLGRCAWRAVDLPAADTLTLAHPSFGVAYAPWTDATVGDGRAPDASSEPGAIEFVAGRGAEFSLGVAVWPAWPGTGDVFSRPSDRMLRTVLTGAASHVVAGLPRGTYRFDYAAAPGRGPPGTSLRRGAVAVDGAAPRPRVEVTMTTE